MADQETCHVLLVEDDEEDYLLTKDLLTEVEDPRTELSWVRDFRAALDAARSEHYDVCLVDYRLGGAHDGIDLIRALIADGHQIPVVLLTGEDTRKVDVEAAEAGASDFLVKGQVNAALLERTIRYAMQSHAALQDLKESYRTTVRALATALEMRDDETGAHAARVAGLAMRLTQRLAPEVAADPELEYAFLLHDIGKIGVPDRIVLKPGPLDPEETEQMRNHVRLGEQIIAQVPFLNGRVKEIITSHHERWDGNGYPRGLQGEEIPLTARIFAVVDTYDAMTNDRPYRKAMHEAQALEEIRRVAGTQLDPAVVREFLILIAQLRPARSHAEPVVVELGQHAV
jgi:putative two-component system response regulator